MESTSQAISKASEDLNIKLLAIFWIQVSIRKVNRIIIPQKGIVMFTSLNQTMTLLPRSRVSRKCILLMK